MRMGMGMRRMMVMEMMTVRLMMMMIMIMMMMIVMMRNWTRRRRRTTTKSDDRFFRCISEIMSLCNAKEHLERQGEVGLCENFGLLYGNLGP